MCADLVISSTPPREIVQTKAFIDEFKSSNRPKVLFGKNIFTKFLIENFNITAVVDDFSTESNYLGVPIIQLNQIPQEALVVVLSGGRTLSSIGKVRSLNLRCIHYFSLFKHAGMALPEIPFEGHTDQAYLAHKTQFEKTYTLLVDDESRRQFSKVLNFRVNLDIDIMQGFTHREDEQYFESFLELSSDGESFVDIGAYDGFTTESFIKLCPNYHHIELFEPDPDNLALAKSRLGSHHNIHYHQLGLSDRPGEISFSCGGSTASISNSGSSTIQLECLDNLVNEPVSFIKIDIEGAELHALKGASQVISNYHPRLAVAVYHHPDHFWQIPETILSIRDDYDLYFRHYTESLYESVMFFIPRKNSA